MPFDTDVRGVKLNQLALMALELTKSDPNAKQEEHNDFRAVHLYTDGSHQQDPQCDSWAVVKVGQRERSFEFCGIYGHRTLETTATLPDDGQLDSTASEMVGLAVALIAAISDPNSLPHTISSDSSTAIAVAEGRCQYKNP